MKKTKFTTVVGLLAGATLVYFNVRHALNDYGVRDNAKLHPAVLAQAGTTGSSGGSNSGNGSSTTGERDPKELTGTCSSIFTVKQTFSATDVQNAKKALGANAGTSAICKWLLKMDANVSFNGESTTTNSGSWEITATITDTFGYAYISCLNQKDPSCTPVPRPSCL